MSRPKSDRQQRRYEVVDQQSPDRRCQLRGDPVPPDQRLAGGARLRRPRRPAPAPRPAPRGSTTPDDAALARPRDRGPRRATAAPRRARRAASRWADAEHVPDVLAVRQVLGRDPAERRRSSSTTTSQSAPSASGLATRHRQVAGAAAPGARNDSRRMPRSRPRKSRDEVVGGRGQQLVGRWRTARGRRRPRSTATRSPSLTASSMSWVTNTIVLRSSACSRRSSSCRLRAHDRVDGAERLVHQQHRRVGGQRAGDADPLLLAAGELAG